ncbi:MAG: phosphatidylglycerol lysyltransferase domain-containing protein [Clostridiales bacterium]|nr:phosphatidylglycerol lysyltransferase domain-containing protein [Clostridiales bacterium]
MYIFDNEITIENRSILEEYLHGFEYKTSGLSFSSLYMWRNINHFSWQMIGEYMCLAGISHLELEQGIEEMFLFPPLTKNGEYDPGKLKETILEARRIFEEKGQDFSIRLLPMHMVDIIKAACPGGFRYIDDRPNYDYVYKTQDLIDLKGREYHAKKNHLNYFNNHYEYKYVKLTSAMADDAMRFIDEFNKRKEIPEHEMVLLKMEEDAMRDAFQTIEAVGYLAGAILINDKIEAISLGGVLGKNTVTVHVEKANISYRGLYQAINNEFCKHVASNVKFINREEDMGIPNLRKAKLSYKPAKLVEKYILVPK